MMRQLILTGTWLKVIEILLLDFGLLCKPGSSIDSHGNTFDVHTRLGNLCYRKLEALMHLILLALQGEGFAWVQAFEKPLSAIGPGLGQTLWVTRFSQQV